MNLIDRAFYLTVLALLVLTPQAAIAQQEEEFKKAPVSIESTDNKFHPVKFLKHVIFFPLKLIKDYVNDVEQIIYVKYKYSTQEKSQDKTKVSCNE